jgi:hypothetical protein
MIQVSRLWLTVISLTFGLFMGVVGFFRYENFHDFYWVISASSFYFICLLMTTVAFKSDRLPTWAACLNVAAAIYIPIVVHSTHIGDVVGDQDTWYVTALALVFGAMAVREQLRLAIFATIILVFQVLILGGAEFIAQSGLAGAVMLVISAIAISFGLKKSEREIKQFQEQAIREREEILIVESAREEHRERISEAIEKAIPTLRQVTESSKLTKSEHENASDLAQQLEDNISGGRLMTEHLKQSVAAARKRQIEVTLIDETEVGSNFDYADLLELAVAAIDSVEVGRIKLVAPNDESYLLRLTVTRPGVVTPDLDLKLGERQSD